MDINGPMVQCPLKESALQTSFWAGVKPPTMEHELVDDMITKWLPKISETYITVPIWGWFYLI